MGSNPSKFTGSNLPVENVSWGDCRVFFEKLNANGYRTLRLPSEAEWEYACRAGGPLAYSFGYTYSVPGLSDSAWFKTNSGGKTHPVGGKKANAWGLYDMHGNVWEWCQDCYHDTYSGAPTDGRAWETAADCFRVFRGGSWLHNPENCRSAKRIGHTPDSRLNDLGFRLAASSIR